MTESLYRKYRPQTFADVVGQDAIERTLRNALAQNKVSHAYLFCGPRGTGKTTTARLMAKAILCEKGVTPDPDGTCESCKLIAEGRHPDVYELDAASRTGVDNVREEIIGRVNFAPTVGRAKIYIIDEVHMLSTAAFNALLKTLEEPPDHVVFILCTTDPNKVPATIHSRCQRFDFHRISVDQIVARLGAVCVAENVEFEPEALELIAERSEGGMRNALTSLEQLMVFSENQVTRQAAEDLLGSLDASDMAEIVGDIGRRDAAACFLWLSKFVETGSDLAQFARDLAEHVRALYILSLMGDDAPLEVSDGERAQLLRELPYFGSDRLARALMILGDLMNELRTSGNARLSFEIALTRLVHPSSDLTLESLAERIEVLEKAVAGASRPAGAGSSSGGPVRMVADVASGTETEPVLSAQAGEPASVRPAPSNTAMPSTRSHPAQSVPDTMAGPSAAPTGQDPVATAAARARAAAQAAAARAKAHMQAPSQRPASQPAPSNPAMNAPIASSAAVGTSSSPASTSDMPEEFYADDYFDEQDDYLPPDVAARTAPARTVAPSQPQPAEAPKASHASFRQPAEATAQASSSAPAASGESDAHVAAALANPAALQRGWQATMAALKKNKPAFGVLFMNTQVSARPDEGVLVVTFPATNRFAYMSVRKPEVYSALEEATAKGFGTAVTVRFEQEGSSASGMSTAPRPSTAEAARQTGVQGRDSHPRPPMPNPVPPQAPRAQLEAPTARKQPQMPRPAASSEPPRPAPAPAPVPAPASPAPTSQAAGESEEDAFASALAAGFGAGISFEEVQDDGPAGQ